MSRSYRKHPYITDQQSSRPGSAPSSASRSKLAKRDANRAVRNAEDVPDGKAYRKFSCSWSIRDYAWFDPEHARRK